MRRFRYQSYGQMQPSTPGAGMDLDSFVIERPSIWDAMVGVEVFSWPTPIMATAQEEGVDTPFYTRYLSATEPSTRTHYKRRQHWASALRSGAYGLGISIEILSAAPDETPVTVGKSLEIPLGSLRNRRTKAWYAAGTATASAPGYSSEFTPASTYSDYSCRLLSEIQRHMLESTIDGGLTWSLWTQTEVLSYLNQRIVRFIMETGMLQTRTTVAATEAAVDLPGDKIDLRRVAWDSGSSVSVLTRTDAWAQDHGQLGWYGLSGTPFAYIEEPLDPLTIQLVNAPSVNGTVDMLYVQAPTAIAGGCVNLPIPAFMTPYIKYGVMSDMLMKQGEANDPQRASYCENRFREGVELVKLLMGTK